MTDPGLSFGTWIKRRRKALDLTQHELAGRVGCSVSLIFKIESDERRPSRQIAELLVTHLQIPDNQRERFLKVARQEKAVDTLSLEPAPPVDFARLSPSSLPVPLTPLIGRDHELQAIVQQIQNPGCRLLTLTGPGGVGKTRLALEAAHRLQSAFRDGVRFVSLVGTSAAQFIVPAIADALRFSFSGSTELKAQLFNYLRNQEMLLVLDNLEHLLDGIVLLDELLEHASQVRLLTTSREQLNLRAEWGFEVQGLPVPVSTEPNELESNSAAALFIQRARQVSVNLALSGEDMPAVARICQLVEGSPLGLELAASWLRTMTVPEIAREIERSIDFLTTRARDMPQRHRSMRAVFDYSWDLLSERERLVMMQLSVFRGGFTREAAEEVAGATLLDLSALVQKSLLRHSNGGGRYDFHELIRQYAAAMLRTNDDDYQQTHGRHAAYYAAWLRRREQALQRGPELQDALIQINREIDNLRYAWDWMVTHCEFAGLRDSLVCLFVLHDIRNWIRQGAALFEQAVVALESHAKKAGDTDALAITLGELMTCEGHMRWHLGEMEKARWLFERSLQILSLHRDCQMLAELHLYLSILEHSQGNYPAARRLAEECLVLNREQGRIPGTGYALSSLGMICLSQGEYEKAYAHLEESVHIMRLNNHPRGIAIALYRLGAAALQLGRYDEAQQALEESLEITRRFDDRWGIGNALNYLGLLAFARKDLERAESLIREARTVFEEDGDPLLQSATLADLGYVLHERRRDAEALETFRQALKIAMQSQARPTALHAILGIAELHARAGEYAQAFELAAHSRGYPSSSQQTKDRAARLYEELRLQLTDQQHAEVHARVREKPLETLFAEILVQ